MGCGSSKDTTEPQRVPKYHPFNAPISEDQQTKIYAILQYWFCTQYTQADKDDHVIDLNPPIIIPPTAGQIPENDADKTQKADQSMLMLDESIFQQQLTSREGGKYWDRHTSVNNTALTSWFMGGEDQDKEIKDKFQAILDDVEHFMIEPPVITPEEPENKKKDKNKIVTSEIKQQATNPLDAFWPANLHGRLALIILTDQMSRSIYREDKRAFQYDHIAQRLSKEILEQGSNMELFLLYRHFEMMFFLMPLLHSENIDDVRLCVKKMEQIKKLVKNESVSSFIDNYLGFANDHIEILEKFQRYPHRNVVLGRESTAEELEFLEES